MENNNDFWIWGFERESKKMVNRHDGGGGGGGNDGGDGGTGDWRWFEIGLGKSATKNKHTTIFA